MGQALHIARALVGDAAIELNTGAGLFSTGRSTVTQHGLLTDARRKPLGARAANARPALLAPSRVAAFQVHSPQNTQAPPASSRTFGSIFGINDDSAGDSRASFNHTDVDRREGQGNSATLTPSRSADETGGTDNHRRAAESRAGYSGGDIPGVVSDALGGSGAPLPAPVRSSMESAFDAAAKHRISSIQTGAHRKKTMTEPGVASECEAQAIASAVTERRAQPVAGTGKHDFHDVVIHTDAVSATAAHLINAAAYTVGSHIFFGAGRFEPGTRDGDRLLAHELTHVVQQTVMGQATAPARLIQRDVTALTPAPADVSNQTAGSAPTRTPGRGASPEKAPDWPLPPGKDFQWHRQGMTFVVVVSKQWLLRRNLSPDTTQIDAATAKEMVSTIVEVAPWADLPRLKKEVRGLILKGKLADQPDVIPIRMDDGLAAFVGIPPGEQIVVQPGAGGAVLFVDSVLVREHAMEASATKIVDSAFSALLFGALEKALGQTMGVDREPGSRAALYRDWEWDIPVALDRYGRAVLFSLSADDLADLFGPDWAEKARRGAAKQAGTVKGVSIALPEGLRDEWPQIMAILGELVDTPDGPKAADRKLQFSDREALLLLKIAKSKLRKQIVDRIKSSKRGDTGANLADTLEAIIAEQELRDARKRLNLDDPGVDDEEPVLKRPVHGNIVLTGGRPVPLKEAVFTFEVTDDVDALRAPLIQIQWVAYPKGWPKFVLASELNTYSPLRGQGPLNDKLFEVTFPAGGNYVVEAIVHHNFFLPAHFSTELKILTEEQETTLQEKGPLLGFASPKGATTKEHEFDVGDFTSAVTDYGKGTITRGKLDPAFAAGTIADRLKVIDTEIARVEKLSEQYRTRSDEQSVAVANWAADYLEALRSGREKVESDAKGARVIPCTGVYVSRSKKAPSKALNLVCLQKRTATGSYHVSLDDLSQVYEDENYFFEADEMIAEKAYETVFIKAAESYPDGTLSIAFQGWDEKAQAPTDNYLKFRKVTDTIGKDIKTNVFDPSVNIAVNIAAAVMMVIPGLQAAGFALAVIWNTSNTLAELDEKAAKGTLRDKDYLYAGASFALDLVPLVGRSARVISMGRKAYFLIEGVQLAGQALLISAQGADQIEKLRNGVISKLAKLNERVAELERINPSDPELEALRDEQQKLIKEGEDAVVQVYGSIVAQQGLIMIGGALIQQAATKKFAARLSELETKGRFANREGEPAYYDYANREIVGDRDTITPAEFDRAERNARLSERLEAAAPDPATRASIVESLGDGPVEIVTGAPKTHLEVDGDRKILHIGENARPDEILNAAQRAKSARPATGHAPSETKPASTVGDVESTTTTPVDELRKPSATTTPQFGLDGDQTRRLLDAVGAEQAQLLHDFFGEGRLRALFGRSATTSAGTLKHYAQGIARANAAAAAHPRAAEGLARLGSKPPGGHAAGPVKIAEILGMVPEGRMEVFLRAVADPAGPHPQQLGEHGLKRLAYSVDELGFINEYGAAAYKDLQKEEAFRPLLERLRGLEPDDAQALVDAVRSARGKQGKLKAAGIEPPDRRPRRATGKIAADKDDPSWQRYLDRAKQFAEKERGNTEGGTTPYKPTEEQVESLAVMYQIRENAARSRALPHDKRIQMLDEFDALGRSAGLKTQWINNLRGGLSETLFAPNVGRNKARLPHPDGGFTILDYAFEPGQRPGSKTGRTEWVEQKSDLITAPPGTSDVFTPAVGRAKRYVMDAALDMKALEAGAPTKGDTILIEFVRPPGNDATQQAMLTVLFGEGSPLQAVKFADGPWIQRSDFLASLTHP